MKAALLPGRTIIVEGKEYLYFGGTAYLGLHHHPSFQEIVQENLKRWGTAWGSSRHSNVILTAYDAAETFLMQLTGAPAVCTVSSGMMAGRLVVEALRPLTHQFFHLPGLHPAIQVSESLPVFPEENKLHPELLNETREYITIITDAVPSFAVEQIDLSFLQEIPPNKKITLVIDESHSLGLCGPLGAGITFNNNFPNVVRKIMVASLGKAMGVAGGMIGADNEFLRSIHQAPVFVGGAGMAPAFAQTLFDAKEIIHAQQVKLKENLTFFYPKIEHLTMLSFSYQYPVLYPLKDGVYELLLSGDILITHFQYATSEKKLSRIVLSAHHTFEDLSYLAKQLQTWEKV